MKFTAAGDMLLQRRIPVYEGFEEMKDWICQGDARFFNLETTLHREGECFGFTFNGGSYLRTEPEVLDDCKRYGFNMTECCNNHAMDFAYDGLMKTYEHIRNSGLVQAGIGRNLDQAAAPNYLDLPEGRVALIAVTGNCNSTYNDVGIAGHQSRRCPGRPGLNQLRFNETIVVTQEQMDQLQAIAEQSQVNAGEDIARREGYRDPVTEGTLKFGKHVTFKVGETTHRETHCNPVDLARVEKAIYEAQLQADYILISVHCHDISGSSKENPPQYLEEFARHCIDMGADAIIGHGPHLLRPVEIYKGKPIFYSLGDFAIQNENIPFFPEEGYAKQGLTSDATMHDVFKDRSKNFTRGLQTQRVAFETVVPLWEMKDGEMTSLKMVPVELDYGAPRSRGGLPRIAKDNAILERLAVMSEPYGTKMEIKDGVATVVLK